jgi:hypothetical protein
LTESEEMGRMGVYAKATGAVHLGITTPLVNRYDASGELFELRRDA